MGEPGILQTDLMQRFVRINLDVSEIPSPTPENGAQEENQETLPGQGNKDEEIKPSSADSCNKIPPDLVTRELTKKKSKRKRKRSKHEELYTDKDRAAAVNMGNRDIKQSLKLKRKEDRSKNMLIPEEAEPGTFLALGEYEMKRGDLKMALSFVNKVTFLSCRIQRHTLIYIKFNYLCSDNNKMLTLNIYFDIYIRYSKNQYISGSRTESTGKKCPGSAQQMLYSTCTT